MPKKLLVASTNPHKLAEIRATVQPLGYQVVSPQALGLMLDVPETGATFEENARLKAEAFSRASGMLTLADDSGLVVDALFGEPGVYSARYAGPNASDSDRLRFLLSKLQAVPPGKRTARFVAAVALASPAFATVVFEASVDGSITKTPRGSSGFGYDPIFLYPPSGRTFAEMNPEEKAQVSHRGRALMAAARFLSAGNPGGILGCR